MTNNRRRRAVVVLTYEDVATMLELPDGLTVTAIFPDQLRDALTIKVVGDMLDEIPDGHYAPDLPMPDQVYLVDSEPILDALRKLHYEEDDGSAAAAICHHCEDPWPCPTMTVATADALAYPVAIRRLKVTIPGLAQPKPAA